VFDAGIGLFLKGDGKGSFSYIPNMKTGFFADKDIRNMLSLNTKKGKMIFVVNNNDFHDLYLVNQDQSHIYK
jgi:hypothetical protein